MERALALERLATALANAPRVPTPSDLAAILARAEIALFLQRSDVPSELVATGWYLIGVAQAPDGLERYSFERRTEAWRVAAHIFDLALEDTAHQNHQSLRLAFAAQLGYFRGGLQPNALAIYQRARKWLGNSTAEDDGNSALAVGVAFLGMARGELYERIEYLEGQIEEAERVIPPDEQEYSPFLGLNHLLTGIRKLMRFLLKGDKLALKEAREVLHVSSLARNPVHSLDLRWVAASLFELCEDLSNNSMWTVLPTDVQDATKRAFTYGSPPVLALWPPQKEILAPRDGLSPLSSEAKRVVLGVPTSGGKTLVSQLLAMDHVNRRSGGVCFVVPTRSLARELASSLDQRFAVFRKQTNLELDLTDLAQLTSDITIVTPERLAQMLRHDASRLMERFTLFVFDEAHSLADDSRGFALEACIAIINSLTKDTAHRIVMMSAAIGNRAHIATWLSPDGTAVTSGSPWRGPRRVHAIYSTDIAWDEVQRTPRNGKKWVYTDTYPMFGTIRLRMSANGEVQHLRTTSPVGKRVVKVDRSGNQEKNAKTGKRKWDTTSTPFHTVVAELAQMLGEVGPVLIVANTRKEARRLAQGLARGKHQLPELAELSELVRERLGDDHPLASIIGTGVAYHHGGLPSEILSEVERAIKRGLVRLISATSGLIDGVNLPVRTVIVAEAPAQDWATPLSAAQIINAFGRAGRACMESEGWAVLARQAPPQADDFSRINPADEQLALRSTLLGEEALNALADFEEKSRHSADALFDFSESRVSDFISFIWAALALGETNELARRRAGEWAQSTLAWTQLDTDTQTRWRALAEHVEVRFALASPEQRQRWSRSACSLGTAKRLDDMAESLGEGIRSNAISFPDGPEQFIDQLNGTGILHKLLSLPEIRTTAFWDRPAGSNKRQVQVDLVQLLKDWIRGTRVGELADTHLHRVPDHEYRHEQMGDFISTVVEHHLSWTVASILERANAIISSAPRTSDHWLAEVEVFDIAYARYLRHGVSKSDALELLRLGVKSRTFAQRVACGLAEGNDHFGTLEERLARLGPQAWRVLFEPSRAEYAELLVVVRDPQMTLFANLVEGLETEIPITVEGERSIGVRFAESESGDIELRDGNDSVTGRVAPHAHSDVKNLLATELPYAIRVGADGRVYIRLLAD